MPKWTKYLCLALCVLSTLFCAIGYASITGTMTIRGNVELDPPPIYISDVVFVSLDSGGTLDSSQTAETVMTSQISLTENKDSTVILRITVKNTTEDIYGYNATIRTAGINDVTYSNGDIVYAVYSDDECTQYLDKGAELAPKVGSTPGEITFYVKFYYADKADIDSGGESLNSVLNFQFLTPPPENTGGTGDTAVDGALDQFENILNDSETFTTLTTEINKNYDGSRAWTGTFIGNVNGAETDDNATMQELFANKLHLNIDGEDVALTAIVKWEDVDGNTNTGQTYTVGNTEYAGAEMTLYLTEDALNVEGSDYSPSYTTKPVYVVVYTKDADSDEWYQLGEIYEGRAKIVGYFGGTAYNNGTDSFDTGSWRSEENYYGVYSGATIGTIIQRTAYDISELQALAEQAHALYESNYTAESWAPLQTALDHADAAISNNNYRNMTQSKIETLERQLKEAIQGLVSQTGS